MAEKNEWGYYQTKTLGVFPYMSGVPVYKDGMLPYLYTKTREEDKIELVFCGDDINQDSFVDFFVKRKTLQVLARIEDDKTIKPCGYCWLDSPVGVDGARAAICGFCFFDEAGKTGDARSLGMLGLAYWMLAMRVDVIHGIMLEGNIQARNFAANVGFKEVAVVPNRHYYKGSLVGARVMMIERNDFELVFEEWFSDKKVVETAE
jgi:RimJ/RimL family protein N-acetyltransferase